MIRRKYAALLFDRGCPVLSIALYLCKDKEYKNLQELLLKTENIELKDPERQHFTDEEVKKLQEFEKVYGQFLLSIILTNDLEDPFHLKLANRELDLQEQDMQRASTNFNINSCYGYLITFLAFLYIFMLTWLPIPPDHIRFADTALGAVIGSALQPVLNHYLNKHQPERMYKPPDKKKDVCEEEEDE